LARLFIHATNIHHGGGAVLLIDLLKQVPNNLNVFLSVDERILIPCELPSSVIIERIRPTIFARFLAEFRLARKAKKGDQVLCFGNLPPFFTVKGEVSVFIQNRYLVDYEYSLARLPLKMVLQVFLYRIWLILLRHRSSCYFVQTSSMKSLSEKKLGVQVVCSPIVPLAVIHPVVSNKDNRTIYFDFIYVASGEPHKNHKALIEAWCLLAEEGLFPSLALTLPLQDTSKLIDFINFRSAEWGLNIFNLGILPHFDLIKIYQKSRALIYPSDFESFGLPLLEARYLGLDILASELDYIRDVIDPDVTFDPHSPLSIARAVKRYMNMLNSSFKPIKASDLLSIIMKSDQL